MPSLLRTLLLAVLASALVVGGLWRLMIDRREKIIAALEAKNEQMRLRLEEKVAMIGRLSRSRRIAHVHIIDQELDPEGSAAKTMLRFIELDDQGSEIARQDITVPGGEIFVDAWTVKFRHEDVAEGNPMRGRTLVLLRRIFSEQLAPIHGVTIDTPGAVPPGYAVGEIAQFEKKLWSHFWDIATDPGLAAAMDVRVAQGEIVYKRVEAGEIYELSIDSDGGMNLVPLAADDAVLSAVND